MKLIMALIFSMLTIGCKSTTKKSSTEKLEDKAYAAYESGDFLKSIKYFDQLIKKDSLNGSYFFTRGYSYSMLLKKDDAIRNYLQSAQLDYKRGSSFFNIGVIYTTENDSLALIYFKEALKIYPEKENFKKEYEDCLERLHFKGN